MKHVFLGLALLLSTQTVGAFASDNHEADMGYAQEVNVARSSSHEDRILPRVGKTLFSTSSTAMFADGTTAETSSTLTVLNKSQGLARISIGSIYGAHEFLIGRVGDEYFGTSIDREGTIVLERVSERHLEITFTRVIDLTGVPLQVRARFRL